MDFSRLIVTSLMEDERGTLWIATKGDGLLAYTPATGAVRQYRHDPHDATSLASDVLTTVVVDREGNVWAGRDGGNIVLSRLDRETGVFEHYASDLREGRYLSVSGATTLHVGPNGAVWAGSNRGLSRIDPASANPKPSPSHCAATGGSEEARAEARETAQEAVTVLEQLPPGRELAHRQITNVLNRWMADRARAQQSVEIRVLMISSVFHGD